MCSFRHYKDTRAKPTPKTAPLCEPPTQRGRSASRKKNIRGWSPSGKFAQQPCKDHFKGICTKSPCDYWHLPNVNSVNLNRDVNSVISAHLHTGRLKVNPAKNRKGMVTKVRWLHCKMCDSWVAYFRTLSRRNLR